MVSRDPRAITPCSPRTRTLLFVLTDDKPSAPTGSPGISSCSDDSSYVDACVVLVIISMSYALDQLSLSIGIKADLSYKVTDTVSEFLHQV